MEFFDNIDADMAGGKNCNFFEGYFKPFGDIGCLKMQFTILILAYSKHFLHLTY